MEPNPYAVFVFKRRVKTFKSLLEGRLKEEKDFFQTLKLPKVTNLKELAESSEFIKNALKAFSILEKPLEVKLSKDNNEFIFEISEHSEKPYSIVMRIIPQDIISAFRETNYGLPVATVLLDNESRILDANPQFERLFGYKKEEIIGKDLNKLIVPEEEVQDGYALDEVATETGYVRVERTRLAKDGRKIPVLVSGSPFILKGKKVGIIGVYEDIRDLKKIQEAFYYQATHDILTGLPNRYLLEDRFNMEKARAERNGSKVALFFIDVNRFKDINDTYGHDVGDKVLKYVANKLVKSVRKTDSVIRFGGDEFVVVFDEVKNIEDIVSIAVKIVNVFSEPFKEGDLKIDVGVNIGIAVYPDDGKTLEELLRKGDIAMYEAKATGTNNFVFYSKEIEEARLKKISDLKIREFMFKLVFDKAPLPEVIIDDEFNVLRVNETFKNVFNVDIRKVYGKAIKDLDLLRPLETFISDPENLRESFFFSVKYGEKYYNIECTASALKSFGRTFYLIIFKEVV